MAIMCVACTCGSVDKLIRTRLEGAGYKDFLTIPIARGKDKSKSALSTIPQHPAMSMLLEHLKHASKFAVIVGYDDTDMRWVDMAVGKGFMNNVELEHIISRFA